MNIFDYVKMLLPFGLGLAVGTGISKNKYFWIILVSYAVFMFVFTIIASKLSKVKAAADRKLAARNAAVESLNEGIKYTEFGFVSVWGLFDKYYPVYIMLFGVGSLIGSFVFLYYKSWVISILLFILANIFIILNQRLRKVMKYGSE